MFLLKEQLGTIKCAHDPITTYDLLLRTLHDLPLPIERADQSKGVILVACFSLLLNIGFWRCWSDRVLLEIKEDGLSESSVKAYGIPNLLRFRAKTRAPAFDLKRLITELEKSCG
jgi:hypothetical protein